MPDNRLLFVYFYYVFLLRINTGPIGFSDKRLLTLPNRTLITLNGRYVSADREDDKIGFPDALPRISAAQLTSISSLC